MKHVVFVHGINGSREEYSSIRKFLSKRGEYHFHEFEYAEKFGRVPLKTVAQKFADFMQGVPKNTTIIGLSQGGIIAACYLELLNGKKKHTTCITVCSPFEGSYMAHLLDLPGIKDLRPNSVLLTELKLRMEKSRVNYFCVWNPLDLTVYPGISGKSKFAKESLKVVSLLHPLTFIARNTKIFIHNNI